MQSKVGRWSELFVVIMAVIYGLSTDYEVFLLSRVVEARTRGASAAEAVRIGTAHTGRIITAAALILLVVVGAFAFSDLVMMQYIAYGMIAALLIDATVLRMLLVPAVMKMLGDDCWWAPAWMKRLQQRIGLGEPILLDAPPAMPAPSISSRPLRSPTRSPSNSRHWTTPDSFAADRIPPLRRAAVCRSCGDPIGQRRPMPTPNHPPRLSSGDSAIAAVQEVSSSAR